MYEHQLIVAPPAPSLTRITCSVCGIQHILTAELERERRSDGATFYCPNGHAQYFAPAAQSEAAQTGQQGIANLRDMADVQAEQIARLVAERTVLTSELEDATRRLGKSRFVFKQQQEHQDKLQEDHVKLQGEYAKSRRQIGGIGGDRTAFKELALENLRELKESKAKIAELKAEVESLTTVMEGATEAGDELDAAISLKQKKAKDARALADLLQRVSKGGSPKGVSEKRLIEYLTWLYEEKK